MSEWKKISTAPKDGTKIVISRGLRSVVGVWKDGEWYSEQIGKAIDATHWREFVEFPWSFNLSPPQPNPIKQEKTDD